jgi:hypothetical protein
MISRMILQQKELDQILVRMMVCRKNNILNDTEIGSTIQQSLHLIRLSTYHRLLL